MSTLNFYVNSIQFILFLCKKYIDFNLSERYNKDKKRER